METEVEPERRRDGIGLFMLVLALLIASRSWFMLPGIVGEVIGVTITTLSGWRHRWFLPSCCMGPGVS